MIDALLGALGVSLLVGVLGADGAWRLSRRSLPAAVLAAPAVAVLAMGAGVLTGARMMLFDATRTGQLTALVALALVVGLLTSGVLAWQIARREREQAAERARRVTVSHLSHDLRTPLTRIRAMSEALADGVGTDRDRYPAVILEEIDRAVSMADDMLVITTLDAGEDRRADAEPVDLRDLVSDTVAASSVLAAERGIDLHAMADGDLVVRGRARELARALGNLVDNALRHTPDGGTVTVSAHLDGSHGAAVLAVRDQCGGVDAAVRAHMFDAFWREDEARTPSRPGAGLGLTIARAVAQAHGGDATVQDAPGGCEVLIRLPR